MDFSVNGVNGSSAGAGLDWLSAGVQLADSWYTNFTNKKIANQNIDLTRETNAQNEALLRESWARDDNAVQRRVADLKAAGLSPILAAGSAAGNTNPIQLHAPHNDYQRQGVVAPTLSALSAVESLKGQQLDNKLKSLNAQYYGMPDWLTGVARIINETPADNPLHRAVSKVFKFLGIDLDDLPSPSSGEGGSESSSTPWIKTTDYKNPRKTIVDNKWAFDELKRKGVDVSVPSFESHPKDFGITNQDLIQDGTYFIEKMRSDGKLTEDNIKAVANTLGQRYNQRKGDIFDWLMSLAGL